MERRLTAAPANVPGLLSSAATALQQAGAPGYPPIMSPELMTALATLLVAIASVIKAWQAERRVVQVHTIVNSQRDAMIAEIAELRKLLADARSLLAQLERGFAKGGRG